MKNEELIKENQIKIMNPFGPAIAWTKIPPVLVDKFLEGAVELDVDLISDGKNVVIGAIMEQIEMAGVHSGDSACVMPP